MTTPLPLALVTLRGNNVHCLVIVAPLERPTDRAIHPVEIVGQFELVDGQPNLSPEAFARGADFVELMHRTIAKYGPTVPGLSEAASGRSEGYVYVVDGRTPNPQGNVPARDIIGSFRIMDGRIAEAGYTRFPEHRLFTDDGIVQLESVLLQHLLNEIESVCGSPRADA
jgi:hypothetical protein